MVHFLKAFFNHYASDVCFSSVEAFLRDNRVSINEVLPCKGIGVLHLAVGIDPLDKSKQCTESILKYGGDPNLW